MLETDGDRQGGARAAIRRALRPHRRHAAALLMFSALALGTGPAASGATMPAPRLRALFNAARVVVAGQVTGSTSYDDDRVAVVTLAADQVLKGTVPGTPPVPVAIVEMHEGPARPPLQAGMRGIAFLHPAPRSSYLTNTLPQGTYYELLLEYGSFATASSPAEAERNVAIMTRLVAAARGEAMTAAQLRQLTFDLMAAENPLLVEDAAEGVAGFGAQRELTAAELDTLRRVLNRSDLPDRIRVALIDAIAAAGLTEAIPVLQSITTPPPVAEAAWHALDKLGAPMAQQNLDERLADRDPAVRAAAVRELIRRDGVAVISQVAPVAIQDPDPGVRRAAVDALGGLGKPEALPPLERVFADSSGELQQATGRAILAVGGPAAADTLGRLAFEGPVESQRYAVVLLMVMNDPHKQAVLDHVASTHADANIQNLIEHGFPTHEH